MAINPGELTHRLYIYNQLMSPVDSFGQAAGETTQVGVVWARLEQNAASETVQNDQLQGTNQWQVTVRASTLTKVIRPHWWLAEDVTRRRFNVIGTIERPFGDAMLTLLCAEVPGSTYTYSVGM